MDRLLAWIFVIMGASCAPTHAELVYTGNPWEKLEDCRLIQSEFNDGDSFLVESGGENFIFRLHQVDAPETSVTDKDRVAEQASYFGISTGDVVRVGQWAQYFVAGALESSTFTVWTRWHDALGGGRMKRFCAYVEVGGRDLGEMLVGAGLASIHGSLVLKPPKPDLKDYSRRLTALEAEAKVAKRGGWGLSPAPELPIRPDIVQPPQKVEKSEHAITMGVDYALPSLGVLRIHRIGGDSVTFTFQDRLRRVSTNDSYYESSAPNRRLFPLVSSQDKIICLSDKIMPANKRQVVVVQKSQLKMRKR